jgi:hypothetical protein
VKCDQTSSLTRLGEWRRFLFALGAPHTDLAATKQTPHYWFQSVPLHTVTALRACAIIKVQGKTWHLPLIVVWAQLWQDQLDNSFPVRASLTAYSSRSRSESESNRFELQTQVLRPLSKHERHEQQYHFGLTLSNSTNAKYSSSLALYCPFHAEALARPIEHLVCYFQSAC